MSAVAPADSTQRIVFEGTLSDGLDGSLTPSIVPAFSDQGGWMSYELSQSQRRCGGAAQLKKQLAIAAVAMACVALVAIAWPSPVSPDTMRRAFIQEAEHAAGKKGTLCDTGVKQYSGYYKLYSDKPGGKNPATVSPSTDWSCWCVWWWCWWC